MGWSRNSANCKQVDRKPRSPKAWNQEPEWINAFSVSNLAVSRHVLMKDYIFINKK